MTRPTSLLLVTDDPDLIAEWRAAEEGLTDIRVLARFADTTREAVRTAQSQQPDVICLAMPRNADELEAFVAELREAAPAATHISVIDRRQFDSGDAETAFVVEATRAGLRDFLRRPLSSSELSSCIQRAIDVDRHRTDQPTQAGQVTAFVSNKGGVGKTTLAVNLACELAQRHPGRVLLVDVALQLGLCATMLDLEPDVTMLDVVTQINRLDSTLLRELTVSHGSGLDLLAAPGGAVDAASIREEHVSRLLAVARTAYDHVIVDTFPILDGIAISTLDRADHVWLVVAPTVPTVLGAERMIELLEGVGVEDDRQRIVVNTSVPMHTGQLSPRDVATRLDRNIDVVVPFSRAAVSSCNSGQPVVMTTRRRNSFRRSVAELADIVEEPAEFMSETAR